MDVDGIGDDEVWVVCCDVLTTAAAGTIAGAGAGAVVVVIVVVVAGK